MTDIVERLSQAQVKADAIPDLSVNIFRDAAAEIERLRAASEWRDISTALEPFVRAAQIIASRPQDYKDRIVAIGGLATAADLTKRHFSDLLAALPAPPQRNEVTK